MKKNKRTKETKQLSESQMIKRLEKTAWTLVKTVVDTTPNPFLILDPKLRVIAANKYFYQTFKVSPKQTENKLIYNLGNNQWNIPELSILLEKILPKETYFRNFKVKHNFPKIGEKVMLLNARQIYEKTGVPKVISTPIILLVIEDITELERSQEKAILVERVAEKTRAELEQQKKIDEVKTEFVSLASHQLKTPPTAIKLLTERLLGGKMGKLTEKQKEYFNDIRYSNQRMIDLVNALLNMSRIELGMFSIQVSKKDALAIMQSILDELKPIIYKKRLKLKTIFPEKNVMLMLDESLFHMVISNIIINAFNYTAEKGKIKVECKVANKGQSLGGKFLEDNYFVVIVSDTGYGIPQDQQSKVFTKFFRADNVREKHADGTGLGLYIVKSILDHSGGLIWFTSRENEGSVFYVAIPISGMKAKAGEKNLIG